MGIMSTVEKNPDEDEMFLSPVDDAINKYKSFVAYRDWTQKYTGKNNDDIDNDFSMLLEDFIVNNNYIQVNDEVCMITCNPTKDLLKQFSHRLNTAIIMVFIHRYFSYAPQRIESMRCILDAYNVDLDKFFMCEKHVTDNYVWDGYSFYKWSGTSYNSQPENINHLWVRCAQEDVRCITYESFIDVVYSYQYNLTHADLISEGIKQLNDYIYQLHLISKGPFKTSPFFNSAINYLKLNPKKFNTEKYIIPCKSQYLKVLNREIALYDKGDLITFKMNHDFVIDTSNTIKNYIDNLSCNKRDLATHIMRWGCAVKPTITFVYGPAGCGISTLFKVCNQMYNLYTVMGFKNNVNYDVVHTSFVDDYMVLDKNAIKNHQCKHLVVAYNPKMQIIGNVFAGRIVKHLEFYNPVESIYVTSEISEHLNTTMQRASLLTWAYDNYDHTSIC